MIKALGGEMSSFKARSKQALTILLAFLLLFAMVPNTLAGGAVYAEEWGNTSTEGWGITISTDKAAYDVGEDIRYNITGFANTGLGSNKLWLGLYKYGADYTTSIKWKYINGDTSDGSLKADLESYDFPSGHYFLILTTGDNGNQSGSWWATLDFSVGNNCSLSTDKAKYTTEEPIKVTATSDHGDGAWVGLYPYSGDLEDDLLSWYYVKDASGQEVNIVGSDDILHDADKAVDLVGRYKVILFTGGYNIDKTEGHLAISSFWIGEYENPTWTWNEDHEGATATFTEKDNPSVTAAASTTEITAVEHEATCTAAAYTTYTATLTADKIRFLTVDEAPFVSPEEVVETGEPLGHLWGEWEVVTPATEEAAGVERHTCTRCDAYEERPIPQLTHQHLLTEHPAVEATCTTAGNTLYYDCSGCGKYFSDAEAEHEITENSWVIPALGHDWGAWVFDSATKTHTHVCANDSTHTETDDCTFTHAPSSDPDIEVYTCTVCGGQYEQSNVPVITTDKSLYKYGEDIKVTTELNGHNGSVGGGWIALQYKGESYSAGSLLWYYPACFDNPKTLQSILTPSNTSWENTNGDRGTDKWTAIPAGEYEIVFLQGNYERVGKPAYFTVYYEYNDPTWTWAEDYSSATATFKANGMETVTETLTDSNPTAVETLAPKCTETGIKTHSASVSVPESAFVTVSGETVFNNSIEETIAALGHNWGEWEVVTPATEEAEGLERHTCTRCDAYEDRPIPQLTHQHSLTEHPAVAATCTTAGNTLYYDCSGCGKYFSDAEAEHEITENSWVIPALGHAWSAWTFDGEAAKTHSRVCANDPEHTETDACSFETVISGNVATHTCSVCNGTYTTEVIKTDKTVYAANEPIMVTTDFSGNKAWVGLYKKGESYNPNAGGAKSIFWYYLSEAATNPIDIKSTRDENGRAGDFLAGDYKVVLFNNDSYTAEAEYNFTVTHTSSMEIDRPKPNNIYTFGEPVKVTATSDYTDAWVGLFDCEDPVDFTNPIASYDVKDHSGEAVDILAGVEEALIGDYRVILCSHKTGDDMIDRDADGNLTIRTFKIKDIYTGPTWEWDNNLTSATAIFTAQHNAEDTKEVEAVVTSEVTKPATEEEDGLKTYTATVESVDFATVGTAPFTDTKTEVIPRLTHVHTCVLVEAKAATCTEAGNIEYYECSGCHKFFEDEEATKEIEDKNSVVIKATGHDWGVWVFDPETRTHTHTCANDPTHTETFDCTFEKHDSPDPDTDLYVCTVCGGQYEQANVPVITTDKTEYEEGEDIYVVTELNGYHGHANPTDGWVALYEAGQVEYNTSLLWYYPEEFDNPKLLQSVFTPSDTNKENMGDWPEAWGNVLPEGEYELVFLMGSKKPYTLYGKPAHFTVKKGIESETVIKEPTCTEDGLKHVVYKDGTEADIVIPALGHDPKEEWVHDPETRTHYHECTRCDAHVDETPCTFDEGTVTKEATVTEEGEMLYTCTVCGGTYTEVIPNLMNQGVKRVYGSSRYETAILQANELKATLGIEKFDTIIVATGNNFADALSGAYLGYVKQAPILLVFPRQDIVDMVQSYIEDNLAADGTVYILGGEAVVPKDIEDGISATFTTKRLFGANRYETNIEILKEVGVGNLPILVCDGNNYADSLSASAAKLPILVVNKGLNDDQKEYLKSLPGNDFTIIGGEVALPASLMDELNEFGKVARLGGADRCATSVMVAETFFENPEKAVVAYAINYPDGLCGGTLAAYMDAPLLLTYDGKKDVTAAYTADAGIKSGIVLGGSGLVSDESVRAIFSMAEEDTIYEVTK